ncbi:TraI/MobA(P) family conjugative relaxase [Commensalibacter nepenthis]|uniref:DUF5710 domain-containing protein n=1 Tax=Commensalibacter nepenthis TaxID=3043872 RepID=A0ABT6QAU0_9PROT|nr:TraI/MobA(P) family conjugative relaxase [Commensalibacter sp. TBRC 10068]MDI2113872.1 DUF5710 domain-containing protein [Commensalibacter sp. TBRC 10068]
MIAKSVSRSKNNSSYGALVNYIDNPDKQEGVAHDWGNLANYALDIKNEGEKLDHGSIRYSNFKEDIKSLDQAIALVEITQECCSSKSDNKTYHLVVSFPPSENPTKEQLVDIEDELVKSIGFEDHERVSALHTDQAHLHIHIAINKVNPDSYKLYDPSFDKKKLMAACKILEKKHQLEQTHSDKSKLIDGTIINTKAQDKENRSGEKSLLTWVKENAKDHLVLSKTWGELHEQAGKYGLVVKKKGAGLIIAVKDQEKLCIKASDVDRDLSFKKLEAKLGKFETAKPSNDPLQQEKSTKNYQAEPKKFEKTPEAEALWKAYQLEKERRALQCKYSLENIREKHRVIREKARAYVKDQRQHAKIRLYTPTRLKIFKLEADQIIQKSIEDAAKERDIAFKQNKLINWNDFLSEQAAQGDQYALKLLRKTEKKNQRLSDNLFRVENWEEGQQFINDKAKSSISFNGDVRYFTEDGGRVIDKSNHVAVQASTDLSVTLALELASKRFDKPLTINGSDDFKKAVAKAAAIEGSQITFADEEMERLKSIAILERQKLKERMAKGDTYLAVPFEEANKVKEAGAEWDHEKKLWVLKAGLDAEELGLGEYLEGKGKYSTQAHYLIVPAGERLQAKELGAKWDKDIQRWYVPSGGDLSKFKEWMKGETTFDKMWQEKEELIVPKEHVELVKSAGAEWNRKDKTWVVPAGAKAQDIGLEMFTKEYGRFSKERIYLNVSFKEKDKAQELGAKWDGIKKQWFAPPKSDLSLFDKWKAEIQKTQQKHSKKR